MNVAIDERNGTRQPTDHQLEEIREVARLLESAQWGIESLLQPQANALDGRAKSTREASFRLDQR
ncbi:MAG: hypothetical protein AAGF11_03650 [Myxococcota bacterium]